MAAIPGLGFDPLKIINEVLVVAVAVTAVVVLWVNRARVLQAATGDDRIHADCLDFMWMTCCNCCGICTGDWTRCFTKCSFCPRRLRGRNLLRAWGQCFGLTPYTVELKNIVVGDLPLNSNCGDFYLVVENASNPPMMSSLAEEKHPKVVHFPEVITVRLRASPLEEPLRITVRELNIIGSQDLCQCRLDPMHILDWCDSPSEQIKRFEMKCLDHEIVRETPAWILLEFDNPQEVRDLDNFRNLGTVRTATRDGLYQDTPLDKFKKDYVLLDANGHAMDEVPEDDLKDMERLASIMAAGTWFLNLVTCTAIVTFLTVRVYVTSCHHQYKRMTMAVMSQPKFKKIGFKQLDRIVENCSMVVERDGPEKGTPCLPNSDQVMELCFRNSSTKYPEEQPRPQAFEGLLRHRLGFKMGLPCLEGACQWHDRLVTLNMACIGGCIGLVLLTCLFRGIMGSLMKWKKKQRTAKRIEYSKQLREHMSQRGAARTFF